MKATTHTRESLDGTEPYFTDERLPVATSRRAVTQFPKIVSVLFSREEMEEFGTMSVHNTWEQETFRSYAATCEVKESFVPERTDCDPQNVMLVTFYGRREEKRVVMVHVHHNRSPANVLREIGRSIGRKGWMISVVFFMKKKVILNGKDYGPIPEMVYEHVEVDISGGTECSYV